jgi:hypothetical protein
VKARASADASAGLEALVSTRWRGFSKLHVKVPWGKPNESASTIDQAFRTGRSIQPFLRPILSRRAAKGAGTITLTPKSNAQSKVDDNSGRNAWSTGQIP